MEMIKLFFLFIFFLIVNSQSNIDQMKYLRVWQFKNDRNPDFGISLPNYDSTYGIINPTLFNSIPEYCCGDQPKYSDYDNELLVVHNASTFNQWFKSVVENGDYCRNFEHLLPVNITKREYYTVIDVYTENIRSSLEGNGFNNITKYPEYTDDPDEYLFCYSLELDLVPLSSFQTMSMDVPGEYWIFADGLLYFERGGISYIYEPIILSFPIPTNQLNIFGCTRSNYLSSITYRFTNFDISCNIDPVCGTCGSGFCEAKGCEDDITSCNQIVPNCGICVTTARNCEDDDPCTVDSCTEGLGCQHEVLDPNCYCNDDNCKTIDACFPKYCIDRHNCTTEPIICVGNETCFEPHCQFGECECSTNPPLTSIITSTIDTSTISSSSSSTISSTTSSISSSTTSTKPTPPPSFICDIESCPHHYCCIQLHKSYTCVSKYFAEQCNPSNLNQFF